MTNSIVLLAPHFAVLGCIIAGILIAIPFLLRSFRNLAFESIRAGLVALFLGLALSSPILKGCSEQKASDPQSPNFAVLVDRSKSAQSNINKDELSRLSAAVPKATSCYVFDSVLKSADCGSLINTQASAASSLENNQTSLVEAIKEIDSSDIVLVSDGRENRGSYEWNSATSNAKETEKRIYPVVFSEDRSSRDVRIDQINYAPFVTAQRQFTIGVAVTFAQGATPSGSISITRSSQPNAKFTRNLEELRPKSAQGATKATTSGRIDFRFEPPEKFSGFEEYSIKLLSDSGAELDSKTILIGSNSEKEVLIVSNRANLAAPLTETLQEQGFKVSVSTNGDLAADNTSAPNELSKYKAVIILNIPERELSKKFDSSISNYVRSGGTLVMTGGPNSFGAGGYKNSTVAELLPVISLPPETVQKRLSVAVALVLDKSGSMAQGERLDGAKGAARAVVDSLKDEDFISVIGFDDAPFVVIRTSPVGQVRQIANERIGRLFPAGRTNLIPALDEARRSLSKVDAGRKHVIVMTDGRLPDESEFYFELLRQMRLLGMTVSTVLLGGENEFSFLKRMADIGGGGFYQTSDPRLLPRIFLQDIKVSVNAPPPVDSLSVREVNPVSVSLERYPDVKGVSPVNVKSSATLELSAFDGQRQRPLLVSANNGAGRTFAYTSDMLGQQTPEWFGWNKLGEFWKQLILRQGKGQNRADDLGNQESREPALDFTLEQRGEYSALVVNLYNSPTNASPVWNIVHQLSAKSEKKEDKVERRVTEVYPGRYRVLLRTNEPGRYVVNVGAWLPPFAFSVSEADFKDRIGDGIDEAHLARIANLSGGSSVQINEISSLNRIVKEVKEKANDHDLAWLALMLAFVAQIGGMLMRRSERGAMLRMIA